MARQITQIIVAAACAVLVFVVLRKDSYHLYTDQVYMLRDTITTVTVKQLPDIFALPTEPILEIVQVRYPQHMKIDESRDVRLTYKLEGDPLVITQIQSASKKIANRSASLSGGNFTVKPSETLKIPSLNNKNISNYEYMIFWSISPVRTGSHQLILDLSQLLVTTKSEIELISEDTSAHIHQKLEPIILPVNVYTIWNISEQMASIIKWCIGLIGFLLALQPFYKLVDWSWRRLHTSKWSRKSQ